MRVDVEHCLILCKRVSYDDTDFEIEISKLLMDACIELKAARKVVDAARDNIDAKEMPHKCYETPNCVTCEEIWTRINSSEDRIKMALKELDGTAGSKNG